MNYIRNTFHHAELTLLSILDNLLSPQQQRASPSPATMAPSDDKAPQPTSAEAFLFYSIVKNLRTRPDIDWEGVARDNGFKNAETAKVRYGQVKRKLNIDNWAPPVKAPGSGKSTTTHASGSGLGKTEPDGAPTKPKPATGAGVKKRAPATNAHKKPAAKTTTKHKTTGFDGTDDSEPESMPAAVRTPNNPVGAAAGTPIRIEFSSPSTVDSNTMRPAKGVTTALARLSPTPIGRTQSEINIDNYISSLQTQTPFPPSPPISQPQPRQSQSQSLYPPPGVRLPDAVYRKAAIPVRGLGDAWTTQPVTTAAHEVWFNGLSIVDQNRFMEEAVAFHMRQSEGMERAGSVEGEWVPAVQQGNGGGGHRGALNGSNGAAAAALAAHKGKKLADIPYHPDFIDRQEQEEVDGQLENDMGIR
ncbi:hypothetical protein QBC36DRAFT_311563 [Triangularia setosa]|uniref:Uncharacterized protein n=1 Tax=Triangularia setosa TaxID=2587417 RepID=A0AAN7A7A6_9PEZI|nr:hypothetical protein QBC36DRAFT_311563 [Podospora setosa]